MLICKLHDCLSQIYVKGYCNKHYRRLRKHGDPRKTLKYRNHRKRFTAYTTPEPTSGCLLWTGSTCKDGYGQISVNGKMTRVPRYVWTQANGAIPAGMLVCHTCDNPACCEITHLFLGTAQDNSSDMVAKGRSPTGTANGRAVLTENDVRAIRKSADTNRATAVKYGVSSSSISNVRTRKYWRQV